MRGRKRAFLGREHELIEAYQSGAPIKELSEQFGVTRSTVELELKRLGIREPTKGEEVSEKIERHFAAIRETDEFHFCLGVIWGLGAVNGDRFRVRYQKRKVIQRIADILKHASGPYRLTHQYSGENWAVHVPLSHPIYTYLVSLGWKGRWNEDRPYPSGLLNEDEFIRGFVSVHHTLDTAKVGKGRYVVPRLRIYGSRPILEKICAFFVAHLGMTPKKVQTHGRSEVCHILYYQSKREVPVLMDFLKS